MPTSGYGMGSPFGISGPVPGGSPAPLGIAGAISGGGPAANVLGNQYQSAYQQALANNQNQYRAVLQGYGNTANQQYAAQRGIAAGMGQTLGNQQAGQQAVLGGYGNLSSQVQGLYGQGLSGLASAQEQIGRGYDTLGGQVQSALGPMQTALEEQRAQNARTQQGYTQLGGDVMNTLKGVDASQRQAIQDAYAAQVGAGSQSLASRGLGNSTVVDSVNRGLLLDKSKADIALSNSTAQLMAGYQSQLGLAGLGFAGQAAQQNTAQQNALANARASYGANIGSQALGSAQQASMQRANQQNMMGDAARGIGMAGLGYAGQAVQSDTNQRNAIAAFGQQALNQNTGLARDQLGFMQSVSSPYPNAQSYAALQAQAGANQQGQNFARQQALAQRAAMQPRGAVGRPGVYQGSYGAEMGYPQGGAPQQPAYAPGFGAGRGAGGEYTTPSGWGGAMPEIDPESGLPFSESPSYGEANPGGFGAARGLEVGQQAFARLQSQYAGSGVRIVDNIDPMTGQPAQFGVGSLAGIMGPVPNTGGARGPGSGAAGAVGRPQSFR